MSRVLKLSDRQRDEVTVNRTVCTAPTLRAVDRFTGVLYDALDAASLHEGAQAWLSEHALIQTALLGPVGATDPLPAFRLSAGHRLPGLPPLKRHWSSSTTAALDGVDGPIVDLRSEAYRALGPVPGGPAQAYVRVVAESGDGAVRALNHFNKKTKGLFTRALAQDAPDISGLDDLVTWASGAGFSLRDAATPGEILLIERT